MNEKGDGSIFMKTINSNITFNSNKSRTVPVFFLFLLIAGCAGSKYYMIRHEPMFSREEKLGKEKVQLVEKRYDTGKETTEESLDISSLAKITNIEAMVEIANLDISPDGQTLIFQAYTSGDIREEKYFNIWSVRAIDGKSLRFITNAETNDYNPCFSPDGNFVVFASGRSGTTKLWKVRKSGTGGFMQLTSGPSTDGQPDVSPDGKKIAFASISPVMKVPHIWIMNSNGSDLTELCEGFSPKWTPDGKKIVFIANAEVEGNIVRQLWVINADGTYLTQILNIVEGDCLSLSISPDGKRIAFSSNMNPTGVKTGKLTNNYDIWLVNIDGTDLTHLTTNPGYDGDPVWSIDGKYIYFCSNRGMKWDVWKILPSDKLPEKIEQVSEVQPEIVSTKETLVLSEQKTEPAIEIAPVDEKLTPETIPVEQEKVQPVEKKKEVKKVQPKKRKKRVYRTTSTISPRQAGIKQPGKPSAPAKVVATPGGGLVILTWEAGDKNRTAGYFIYRTKTSGKDYKRVNKRAFKGKRFVDPEVENGKRYYYVITAVDRTERLESNYSTEVTAFPEHSSILKAREEAKKKKQ